jgi:hypothetical protein
MAERMAVVITERAFGRSSDVGEDKMGRSLRGNSLQIDAVPRRYGRGEDTRIWAKLWVGIVSNAKSVTLVTSQRESAFMAEVSYHCAVFSYPNEAVGRKIG